MQAEIISNGDELTSGKILDTNAQWLSRELADLGVATLYHTTVGDDFDAMVEVLRIASDRSDLILWTGGLGPTADDLTRQAIAERIGVPLEKNEDSLRRIREMFRRRGREMPANNEIQAFQPRGSVPIDNPHGTAPGIDCTVKRSGAFPKDRLDFYRIMAFPGVPAEMKEMWDASAKRSLQQMIDSLGDQRRVLRFRSIHSFGAGESQIEAMLPGIVDRKHDPKVGITATRGTITLRIASEAESEEECFRIMEPTARLIHEKLGDLVYGEGDDRLQDVVCRILSEQKKTLAAVESGTRGLLAESLADSDRLKDCFIGGIVLPPTRAISAEEMILREKRLFQADYVLLVGPYPEGPPDRDRSEETFVAVVDLAGRDSQGELIAYEVYPYVGHPSIIDDLHIKRALNLLRKTLKNKPPLKRKDSVSFPS